MIGLSRVNSESKSSSLNPCGCSDGGCSFIRSTTLTTRTLSAGRRSRNIDTAASVSRVGTSPAHAMTKSGSAWLSLLAHCQIPTPSVQCLTAASGGARPVGKYVAQMSAAARAVHFGARHAEAAIDGGGNRLRQRREKARPAAAAVELGRGFEQRQAARRAGVHAGAMLV